MNTANTFPDTVFSQDLIIKALSASPSPTAIYSGEEMIIHFANAGMLELWGKDASVIGKPLMEAIPELEGQPFLELLQGVWRTGKTYSVHEAPAKLIKNGVETLDYFDYEYRALTDHENKTWCILNTALEVTARREFLEEIREKDEREHALKEEMAATLEELTASNDELSDSINQLDQSRKYIRAIIEQAPVGIAMLKGPELMIEIANPAILKIWGRGESEVLGFPHEIARPELKGQPVNGWLKEVYETGQPKINTEFTVWLKHKDGLREAIVNSIYQPIFSDRGVITGILMIIEEITEQVLARRKNENDQQMLALAIDAGELATFYYQPESNLFSGNNLLKNWFGLLSEENLDLSVAIEGILPEERDRVIAAIEKALDKDSDGIYFIEYRIQNKIDKTVRLLQANGRVFYDSMGNPQSLNGTLRDITQQKREQQRKDEFMGVVSHELKTPLTSLKAYIQFLQKMPASKENARQHDILEKCLKQTDYMSGMITGFLNVSRLDSGQLHIEKKPFDLRVLFDEIEEEVLISNPTHEFIFQPSDRIFVTADRNKISQVLHNLIGNAIKYSAFESSITVDYVITGKNVEINVYDKGIGISDEDQKLIFDRYYRVQDASVRSISGFGIGLYLCKEIIELHNGSISVKSTKNEGTVFSFVLPVEGE